MSTTITVLSWIMATWLIAGSLASIRLIDKPRPPLSAGIATGSLVIAAIVAWLLVGAR